MSEKTEYKMKYLSDDHPRIDVTDEFIEKNDLKIDRSEDDILDHIKEKSESMFNFEPEVLIDYLSWEKAKEFYKDEYIKKVESGEEEYQEITDIKEAVQDFLDYMVFGWMKAMDERGISASRTVSKLGAWLWLFGKDDLCNLIHRDDLYNPYGSPALIRVCEEMGIDVPEDLKKFSKVKC